jgi:MFS superfamily sulfate permease-like transporter
MVVAFVTIYEDPIVGILFGTAVSLITFMEKLSRGQYEMIVNQKSPLKNFMPSKKAYIH